MRKRQAKKNRKFNVRFLRHLQLKVEGEIRLKMDRIDEEIIQGKGVQVLNIRPLMSFAKKGGEWCS